jgi:hypothetical protein
MFETSRNDVDEQNSDVNPVAEKSLERALAL